MLFDQIKADFTLARKNRAQSVGLLSTLVGEITTREKTFNPARSITDDEVMSIVQKFLKNNMETLSSIDRLPEEKKLVQQKILEAEREVLQKYQPSQMSQDELRAFFVGKKQAGVSGVGALMAALKSEHAGQYDGKLASQLARE